MSDSYLLLRKEHAQVTNCMLHFDEPQSQSTRNHYQLQVHELILPFYLQTALSPCSSCHLFVSKPATKRLQTNGMQKVTFGNEETSQN